MLYLCLLLLSLTSTAQEILKYEDLPSLINERSSRARAAVEEESGSKLLRGHLKRSFLPEMEAFVGQEKFRTGFYGEQDQTIYGLRASFNLYRGGRDHLENVSRKAEWEGKRAMMKITSGKANKADRLEIEIFNSKFQQDIARIDVDIARHKRQLVALLGGNLQEDFSTEEILPDPPSRTLPIPKLNSEIFRLVRFEKAQQLSLESTAQILKRWWTPNLELYGESLLFPFREREYTFQRDRFDHALGIKLSFAFDGLSESREAQKTIALAQSSQMKANQAKLDIEARFRSLKQELGLLLDLIQESGEDIEKGEEYLEAILEQYQKGSKISPDVLGAIQKNLELRKRLIELRRDFHISQATLESITGHLKDGNGSGQILSY